MSLTACLKKASTYLPTSDKNDILEKAREYRQQGLTPAAAAVRAVTDQLAQVQAELDAAEQAESTDMDIQQSPTRDQQTETPEFKRFYGDSKLVDEAGKPLVMYHGTSKAFTTVNMKKGAQGLFWMTSDKAAIEAGDVGAQGKGAIMPLYAAIKNPAGWKEYEQKSIAELKRDGYDGIILPDSDGSKTAVIFDPTQVKSADKNNGNFDPAKSNITQSPARPQFYSQLERAIEGVPDRLATMAAPQWKLWLDANAGKLGVKKDEIEFSGVKDYLTLRGKDKVTREEIAGYLGENGVKVKEVVLRSPATRDEVLKFFRDRDNLGFDSATKAYQAILDDYQSDATSLNNWDLSPVDKAQLKSMLDANDTAPKYANYTVPGGTNYREVLITLPPVDIYSSTDLANAKKRLEALQELVVEFGEEGDTEKVEATKAGIISLKARITELEKIPAGKQKSNYQSSHFDQANILAHLRVDDRTDADGKKVFFINEVQGDWGQDGKKKGFNVSVPIQVKPGEHAQTMASIRKAAAKHMMDTANLSELEATRVADTLPESTAARMVGREEEYDSLRSRAEQDMQNEQSRRGNPSGIPSAPFVQKTEAWVGLAIKHAIMHAASNGYDKVAFINGEQAAGLYDLSKQVSLIEYAVTGDQNYKLIITDTNDNKLPVPSSLDAEGVESHVGKEIAQKIIDTATSKYQEISGNGLKVGGEGMKTFYDTLVPQVANDVLKKLGGGKVEDMPLVSGLGITKSFGGWQVVDAKNQSASDTIFKDQQSAWKWIASNAPSPMQKTFDITDAMREKVSAGVPLFSPARDQTDSTSQDQTDTPAFKKWFGDSKVVDADGKPLVVYHGTDRDIQTFDAAYAAKNVDHPATEKGFFFTDKPDIANNYAVGADVKSYVAGDESGRQQVIPAYLSLQNPLVFNVESADAGDMALSKADTQGHDGAIFNIKSKAGDAAKYFVAFDSNQIKSAIGNNGAFDPASNNITESKIREQNLLDGYKVSDFLDSAKQINWWDKTVGTPYHLAQKSPEFKRVFDSVQNFIGDVSRYATRAADLAPTMLPKLENAKDVFKAPLSAADTKALAGPIFEGTLSYTRDKDGNAVLTDDVGLAGVVWRDEELTQMFSLSEPQIKMYREFRKATNKSINDLATSDMIKYAGKDGAGVRDAMLNAPNTKQAALLLEDHLATLASQNPDRANVLQNTARVIKLKAGEAQGLIAKGYAPLTRYGDHTLYVTRGEGENLEQIFFGMYENEREANKASRAMALEYPDADVKVGTMSKEAHKQFQGITPETMALLGDALGLEEDSDSPRSQMFQEMLKLSKSTRSAMKRLIERKGVDGYSDDAGRVLAGFVYSNARQSSQNLNSGEISKSAADIPKEMGDLKDHAIKLVEYAQNPQEEAPAMRGLLFAQFIGGSVASALINSTQSIAVTWPTLSQHFGVGRSGAALTSAITTVKNGAGSDTDLAAAMKRAQDEGITDPLETHQLMGQAQGRGSLKSGDGTKLGDTLAKMSNGMAKVQLIWGKAFGLAEVLNRKLAFVAAYKLAREKGMPDPYAFAKKIVSDSQFVLNKGSNPVWARGAVGATLFTFKKYGVFYLENLARMYGNGPEGKKAFALSLAIMFVLAGAGGFPFADDLDDIIDGFAQRVLNKSFSSKQAKKEFFSKILGDAGAEFVMTGVSGLPGVPIDVSGRLGMSNLIPGTGVLVKKVDHSRDVMEVFGAAGAFASRIITGGGQLAQGDVGGAVENFVPIAIANMIKAKSMADLGYYKDLKNRKVIDTTMTEAVLKAIGFQPSSVKNVQDATMVQQGLIALNKIRETEIADLWTRGRVERKPELIADAKQQLADWNSDNPYSPIKIDGSQINSRVKLANMSKAQRIERSAPKEIRKDVKEHLTRELTRN